jgi:predicted transcriptional regulator
MMAVRELVIKEREASPCATLQQIADKLGVTKERVRQILVSESLPTTHWKLRNYLCNNCGRNFPAIYGGRRIFCSPECQKAYYEATLQCDECGKLFKLRYSELRKAVKRGYQHFYCSRRCRGRAIGGKYGFNVHPENRAGANNKGQL